MTNHERAQRLCELAEARGLDAPTESMIAESIHEAEEDRVSDFIVWLLSVDEKLAKRYENEISLKHLENQI
jgi:hypothetical protein